MLTERLETIVIGAGQAGLGVSRELVRRGVDHIVLERGDIGETWRSQRWDAFRLNSPGWMNRLPDDVDAVEPDAFPSAPEFVRGLERYAFRQRLPVRPGVTVVAVAPLRTAEGFSIATDDGVFEARSVVVASGAARVPRIPAVASALPGSVIQLHAAEFRSADTLPAGAVLVVGGAQSGVQIADDLLDAGRDVYLATSRVGRLPRRYRGRDAFAWLVEDSFFDERLPAPGVAPPTSPQISGAGGCRTLSLQHLERRGATLLGRLTGASGPRVGLADDVAGNAAFADAVACAVRRRIDAHIERVGADAPAPEPDPADEPYPERSLPHGPAELDLRGAGVRSVIWASGFGSDTGYLRLPVVGKRGRIVQREGATAVPGLFVVGQPWQRNRGSGNIFGVAADAPHVAELVARRMLGRRRAAA